MPPTCVMIEPRGVMEIEMCFCIHSCPLFETKLRLSCAMLTQDRDGFEGFVKLVIIEITRLCGYCHSLEHLKVGEMIIKEPCYEFWKCLYITQSRKDRFLESRYQIGDESARDTQDQDGRMTCEEDFNISKVSTLPFNEFSTRNQFKAEQQVRQEWKGADAKWTS